MLRKSLLVVFYFVISGFFLTGCGHVLEFGKSFWGSSTRALNYVRKEAIEKSFECDVKKCFDEVLRLTNKQGIEREKGEEPVFSLFMEKRRQQVIVVMGVPGSVDTTEVGIFFTPVAENQVRIEIASLSSIAKINAAEIIFKHLSKKFPAIE